MKDQFLLSSEECGLLDQFQKSGSLSALCEDLGVDKGFLSRKISKLATTAAVLEKVQGKWALTPQGEEIVAWYREATEKQRTILNTTHELRLATSQTLSERVLSQALQPLKESLQLERILVQTSFSDVEHALLSRKMDCAIFCAIPKTPEVRYKNLFRFPYGVVAPVGWDASLSNPRELLQKYPYVSHQSLSLRSFLGVEEACPKPVLEFDHVSGVRQAVVEGNGWTVLPLYAVAEEVRMGRCTETRDGNRRCSPGSTTTIYSGSMIHSLFQADGTEWFLSLNDRSGEGRLYRVACQSAEAPSSPTEAEQL
jgi:DNA-binding transcriptional LysR family regulator